MVQEKLTLTWSKSRRSNRNQKQPRSKSRIQELLMTSLFENARLSVLQVAQEICSRLRSFFSLRDTRWNSDSAPACTRNENTWRMT